MKFTAFFLLLGTLHLAAAGNAQRITLKLEDAPLSRVFQEIERQTGFSFIYGMEQLTGTKKVDVAVKDMMLERVLELVLRSQPITFTIVDNYVVIKKRTVVTHREEIPPPPLKGKVTSADGSPVAGATVAVKGTNTMTTTGQDGNFEIDAIPGQVLVISFVGFESREIKVVSQNDIAISLNAQVSEMSEVTINTGYQTLPKERITGSFATIGSKELERTVSYSIVDKLEGAVSGLLQDPTGVTIRGVGTLNASRLPLVVLDGFPITIDKDENDYADDAEYAAFQRALESINPNDVENITVLKDAAAASIWGARAANGVIVITTKRTRSREAEINFSTNISRMPRPDINRLPYANPQTQLMLEKGRFNAGWFDAFINNMDTYTYNMSDYAYVAARVNQGLLPASALTDLEQRMSTIDNRQEFSEHFMQPSLHQQYNISVSQNAGFNNYRFSASFDKDNAIMKNNIENRAVLNLTNQFRPLNWLTMTFGGNISFRKEDMNGLKMSDLYNILPHQPFVDANGNYTSQTTFLTSLYYGRPFREAFLANNPWLPYDWNYNLKREFDNRDNQVKTMDTRLQGGITIRPFQDMLVFDMKYQFEHGSIRTDNLYNEETWETRHKLNQFASPTGTHPIPKGSIFDQVYNTSYSHDVLLTGSFFKQFNRHQVAALAGTEIREEHRDRSNNRRYSYNPQTLTWANQLNYGTLYPRNMYPSNSYYIESSFSTIDNYWMRQDRYVSAFGNISYSLDNKYDITGSWRLDQSNMFGKSPKYRQVPLWSVGGAWSIHNEDFFSLAFVDRLRLRATYGASGNVDKSTSPFAIATLGGSQTNSALQLPGAQYINPANPELRWEKTKQFNLGLEFSLMKNRFQGEIEYYHKKGEDLLATKDINSTYGFTSALINFGGINNSGVDINLSAMVINNRDLKWRTQTLFSYNKNVVTKTDIEDISAIAMAYLLSPNSNNRIQAGKPRYYLLSIPWAGLSAGGVPQFYHGKDVHEALTTTLAANTTAYGFDNLIYEGTTQAPYYGSWNNVVSYKQFELSFLATFKFGHVYLHTSPFRVSNNDLYGFAQGNLVPHYSRDFENMWKQPGDELHTDIPRLPFEFTGTSARSKTAWYNYAVNYGSHQVLNAATIRLQRVTLSYALNRSLLPNKVKDLRFLFQARNLHTFTFNKYHEDPERLPDMFGDFLLSTSPEFTFSIQATF